MALESPMSPLPRIALQDSATAQFENEDHDSTGFFKFSSLPVSTGEQLATSPRMTPQMPLQNPPICVPREAATEVVEEGCAIRVRDY